MGNPMPELSQADINRIVSALVPQIVASIRETPPDFKLTQEEHFKAHLVIDKLAKCLDDETLQSLRDLLGAYRKGRSMFFVSFVGLMIAGAMGLVALALGMKIPWR